MASALLIGLASALLGQYRTCGTAATYNYRSYTPAYYQSYAAPAYVAPTYYNAVVEKVLFVPIEQQAYAPAEYADLVGSRQRSQAQRERALAANEGLVARVDQLAGAVDRLTQTIAGGPAPTPPDPGQPAPPNPGGPPTPGPQPGTPPAPQPPKPPVKPAPDPATVKAVTDNAVSILNARCSKCHSGDKPKGGLAFFGADGKALQLDPITLLQIDQATYSQRMPVGRPLNDSEYAAIRAWVNLRADDITDALKGKQAGGAIAPAAPSK